MMILIAVGPVGGGGDPFNVAAGAINAIDNANNMTQQANQLGDTMGVMRGSAEKAKQVTALNVAKDDITRKLKTDDNLSQIATAVQPR
ncbi:MAG: hypothetical protein A3I68_09100 [Candidatus Melainabacteria bacterium RIFCSPLOWO2_02_FULL_35_15]|nr:MAG: hypothetical protein A3F80_03285 [Candidatus Melainabacteria bacterium RIFCSPLOWO2_12_FULL_35_11]OGI13676.1 MAG: hypothetical protein A3I68_09100 [Candidatus Melainabacteria bacterium RIFCSPLOWO2_02_FULL_35_15]